jgi:outer membrane protein OmpA-like peptidoglycan-associated protein
MKRTLFFTALLLPFVATAQFYTLEKLPSHINSQYGEITPVPSRDGNTLYFTRVGYPVFDRTLFLDSIDYAQKYSVDEYRNFLAEIYSEINGAPVQNPEYSAFNQDIWIARGDRGTFTELDHPGPPLNNALPNSLMTITPDPNSFYTMNQFLPAGDMRPGFSLMQFKPDSNRWVFPVPVEVQDFYTVTSDVSLTMSFDGKELIMAAARSDSRDMDLYVLHREGNNRWSAPRHLGTTINSAKRETAPFLSEDNTTLFFGSNRGGNMDIYKSRRLDDTWQNWSTPERLAEPINSVYDDSQPYFNMTTGYIYFTSKRDGNSDIFRVLIAPPNPTEITIIGRVINRKTNALMSDATVNYGPADLPNNTIQLVNGTFKLKIPKGVVFEFTPEKPAFIGHPSEVHFKRENFYYREQYIDLYMDPLEVNARIELRPIYFQQSKAVILEKSFDELDHLANVLRENPGIAIRIEGHTDNVGRPADLQRLSEDRAKAIRDFLVKKGIAANRIEIIGHGPKFPITNNTTDELRQQNRRVEVRITKI